MTQIDGTPFSRNGGVFSVYTENQNESGDYLVTISATTLDSPTVVSKEFSFAVTIDKFVPTVTNAPPTMKITEGTTYQFTAGDEWTWPIPKATDSNPGDTVSIDFIFGSADGFMSEDKANNELVVLAGDTSNDVGVGTHAITVIVSDQLGASSSYTFFVKVNPNLLNTAESVVQKGGTNNRPDFEVPVETGRPEDTPGPPVLPELEDIVSSGNPSVEPTAEPTIDTEKSP